MYKSITSISKRHKRRLRANIVKQIEQDNLVVPIAASSIRRNKENVLNSNKSVRIAESIPGGSSSSSLSSSLSQNSQSLQLPSSQCPELPQSNTEFFSEQPSSDSISEENDCDKDCSCDECNTLLRTGESELYDDLRLWAIECNLPVSHLTKLLKILNKHNHNLPLDGRTLLKTPRFIETSNINPGAYAHLGSKTGNLNILNNVPPDVKISNLIKININIDGLPLSKSSGSQFWPILGWPEKNTFENYISKPFVVGIFHGYHKPTSENQFLQSFVEEYNLIKESGLVFNKSRVDVEINALICDAPAKAYVTYVKNHTGYHGCSKCIQGDFLNNRMTFPQLDCHLRTDESFQNKSDEDHHLGESILENLGIGMVSQVPLDYMHLVCLGVMKRLLHFWYKGPYDVKIPFKNYEKLSNVICSYKVYITKEFCRKPRSLMEVDRFKATEFQQFLLYTGVVALKNLLPNNQYYNFLLLSCAIRILLTPNLCCNMNAEAKTKIY